MQKPPSHISDPEVCRRALLAVKRHILDAEPVAALRVIDALLGNPRLMTAGKYRDAQPDAVRSESVLVESPPGRPQILDGRPGAGNVD
jgi:hypothetical protein